MVGALDVDGDGHSRTSTPARTGPASRPVGATSPGRPQLRTPERRWVSPRSAYGVGGPVGRALVLGSAWTAGPTLAAAHAWSNSDANRRVVVERAPRVAREMSRRLDVGGGDERGRGGRSVARVPRRGGERSPEVTTTERETREAGRRGWFGNRTGASPAMDAERVRARLSAINARKRDQGGVETVTVRRGARGDER